MMQLLAVGAGGFFGACARFGLTRAFARAAVALPLGTLLSNVIAGIIIGFIAGLEQHFTPLSPRVRLLLTTGFLGGLSTFSTFSLETVALFQAGRYWPAAGNVMLNLALSIAGVVLGMAAGTLCGKG